MESDFKEAKILYQKVKKDLQIMVFLIFSQVCDNFLQDYLLRNLT